MKLHSVGAKIGLGCGAILVSLLGIGVFYTVLGSALPVPAPLPLPQPNGYDFYIAAARALVPANPPVDAIGDKVSRTPAEIARNYAPSRRQRWIATNAKSWNLLSRATRLPARNSTPRSAVSELTSDYRLLRELARGQSIRVKDFKSKNQWNAALSAGLNTLQMGRDIERGAPLIGSLVGIAVEAIGDSVLQDVPSHLSATEAKSGARRLERLIAGATPFSSVLSEDKWNFATFLSTDWEKPGNRGAGFWGHFLMPKTRILRSYNQMMDEFIAQADKPARAQTKVEQPGPWTYPVNILYSPLPRSFFNDHRRKTLEHLLFLRLALRAYRLENGGYPDEIESLTPKYLAKIPVDAFGRGERLHYRKNADAYTLWSIGPDEIDNGGAPILNKRGRKPRFYTQESRGDVVAQP
ncbi:hypothetical protein B1R32_10520 [Abditibacterium utsteinense]|uniref:Uncharacterized protein n=1 Tax=Abditibacterium utsteinense TaxID=1960156 RepID=A0A2S8SUA7_9BACT|nr:hypothetical protein [Abditibacterium utsteinense]PQV64339.1 hypothetical protein B1R32_10520 [Abditibacterium utsteinense]